MRLIFCADPFNSREPDPAYEQEANTVRNLGVDQALISFEALVNEGNPAKAVSKVPEQADAQPAFYRGWMLTPEQYSRLYSALEHRGVRLINSPAQYKHCHYL